MSNQSKIYIVVYHDGNGNIDKKELIHLIRMDDAQLFDMLEMSSDELVCYFPLELIPNIVEEAA